MKLCSMLLVSLCLALPALPATDDPRPVELRLAGGTYRPTVAKAVPPDWHRAASKTKSAAGWRYLVVVVDGGLDAAKRESFERLGADLLDYLPVRGYRVRVAPDSEAALRAMPFVSWAGELPSQFKIQPRLVDKAGRPAGPLDIRVVVAAGEPHDRVLAVLGGAKRNAAPSGKDGAWRVRAMLTAEQLPETLSRLAALPEVEAVEEARPLRLLNQDGVWVHQSNVGPSPQQTPIFDRGIFGCGQTLAVADTAQDYDSCYFRDPTQGPPPISVCTTAPCPAAAPLTHLRKDILYYNWSGTPTGEGDTCPSQLLTGSGHGTHTSGSAAGDNLPYADCAAFTDAGRSGGDGQAPGAKLIVQELGDGLEYLNSGGGTIWNLADVAFQSGARIHSFSFGGVCYDLLGNCVPGCSLTYDSLARDADLAMWTYPDFLMVQAAGNGGQYCPPPDSVVTPALAKNNLAVGSVGHAGGAGSPSTFSSRGPVHDGRLKPTVAAQGESVVSAASDANLSTDNCLTCSLDGSSMSAPTTAGLAALVREYYAEGFYATGARDGASGFEPSAALVKATLIDSAVALGTTAPAPDYDSGYGRIQLDASLAFSGSAFALRVVDQRQGLATGSAVTRAYDVTAETPLRFTLVWTDYPAALNAATARVNELKLEVTDPNGDVWFQALDPGSGTPIQTANATDAHDTLNVEERLVFDTPIAGRWIVRVVGVDVPWGPQPFALVVRGALNDCPAPSPPTAPVLSTPADQQVLVSWAAVPGAAGYNVYRSFGTCPAGPWTPVATAVGGTSFLDLGVSGGADYSYYVVAVSDTEAACESPASPCASVVPTGDCSLLPDFRGITSAQSDGLQNCSVTLGWDAASPFCGATTTYNVYRGTEPEFTPGVANRVARCVTGTSHSDSDNLVHGTQYYYVVRAEDGTSGHGGPCNGGNEETNDQRLAVAPDGPPELGTWADDAGDSGEAKFELGPSWSLAPSGGDTGPSVYSVASAALLCTDLTTPVIELGPLAEGPQLSFSTIHDLEYDPFGVFGEEGSIGQVEIATGPTFTGWTRIPLNPDYPTPVSFPFNECSTTQGIAHYFTGTNLTYTTHTASLTNWAGGEVRIRFHLSGDFIYPGGNWWIDDVNVTRALVPGACDTAAVGPPPVPDGASVPGQPLRAARSGGDVTLTWDALQCPATAVNVYRGSIGDYTTFTSGDCDLAPTGTATLSTPDDSWFVVTATDGASTDGSFSRDAAGNELFYGGASAVCPAITQHVSGGVCP